MCKTFIFKVWDAKNNMERIPIVAENILLAEAELRVWGIMYCGGVTFKLEETWEGEHHEF